MSSSLPPEKEKILRTFQRQVERLRKSDVLKNNMVSFQYGTIPLPSGDPKVIFKGYDDNAFQAQLPILRQFFFSNDPIDFKRIRNIVKQYRRDRQDLQEWVEYANKLHKQALIRHPETSENDFYGTNCTVEEAAKNVFYGSNGLFHANIDKPDEEENIQTTYKAMLQMAFPVFWGCLQILDTVINSLLSEPIRELPPVPTDLK